MSVSRTIPRVGGMPELISYQCKQCDMVYTEENTGGSPLPERAIALHEASCTLQ
jgi:hypothetical protein